MKTVWNQVYRKLINKHFAAVQTDTELGLCDNDSKFASLERKAKKFWAEFNEAEREFFALIDKEVR